MDVSVTLRFWHGGLFKKNNSGILEYIRGKGRKFTVDPNTLCWWDIKDMAKKYGGYDAIKEIYYLLPHKSVHDGLMRVYEDKEVLEMTKIVVACRCIDLYVLHGVNNEKVIPNSNVPLSMEVVPPPPKLIPQPKKIVQSKKNTTQISFVTPLRSSSRNKVIGNPHKTLKPHEKEPHSTETELPSENEPASLQTHPPPEIHPETNPPDTEDLNDYYAWYDCRPESPLQWNELIGDDGVDLSDESYSIYVPEDECAEDGEEYVNLEEEFVVEEEEEEPLEEEIVVQEAESSDDELQEARQRVRGYTSQLFELAKQLQREASEGKLGARITSENVRSDQHHQEQLGWVSEYEDSDEEELTPGESEEDDIVGRKARARKLVVSEHTDFTKFEWKVGYRFPNRKAFRSAVAKFTVMQGKNITIVASNKKRNQRIEVKCLGSCPFRLYGSWDTSRACFVVKSVDNIHTCTRNMERNRQMKATWLASQFLDIFKARPHWPAKEIMETVRRAYRVLITGGLTTYKIKYVAHRMLHGSMQEHYNKLGRYLQALKDASSDIYLVMTTNPLKKGPPPVFQRLFVCFDGIRRGWIEGCRRVLCIDACFLKTFLGGQLMAAVGRDGNDQMFPVAWAVVEGESNESWFWFMQELQKCLSLGEGNHLTIISDEHKAIISSVASVLPKAEHRHCARHIFAHWHKNFKGDEMKQLFWRAAKSYNMEDYNEALKEMEKVNSAAVIGFKSYKPKVFCRAFLNTNTKVNVIVNNLAETFNGWIIQSRTKHLIYMLEDIRTALMQRLVVKREQMEKSNAQITPRITARLETSKYLAADCHAIPSLRTSFQVGYNLDTLNVDLEARTCTCRRWDLTGVPCAHAVACIFLYHYKPEDYVANCYKKDTYLKSYTNTIPHIVGERHWPRVDLPLHPPPIKIGPGRPRINRRKAPHENPKKLGRLTKHGIEMTCSICKSKLHNKRRCPDKDKVVEKSQKRQRAERSNDVASSSAASNHVDQSTPVLNATAEPTRIGKGGEL